MSEERTKDSSTDKTLAGRGGNELRFSLRCGPYLSEIVLEVMQGAPEGDRKQQTQGDELLGPGEPVQSTQQPASWVQFRALMKS